MLPGMDGTGELFAPLIARLGHAVHCVVVRYPDAAVGYEALIAHARRALPASGDFFLLGESFSGPVAIALAAEAPERLRGLILSATFVRNPLGWTSPLAPLVRVLPVTGAAASLMTGLILGPFSTPLLRATIAASLGQMSALTIRARLRAIAAVDASENLAAVGVPIVYLRAEHDLVVPQSAARLIARLKPETRLLNVNAPHFLLQVAVDEGASAIEGFMNGIMTGAAKPTGAKEHGQHPFVD